MRILIATLTVALAMTAVAQEKKAPAPPKNLKVLPADTNIRQTMQSFTAGLGVNCMYCHVQGDMASDDNPKKNIAREMIKIVSDVNARFPDGKPHVACWTCHRGQAEPEMNPPAAPTKQ